MSRNFLAGVATVDMMLGDRIVATANTLLDSSISIGSSFEDVRGGQGNKLYGKYFHTSTMDITLTDVMFKLEYLAFQTGSKIEAIADIFVTEQVTIGAGGTGTLVGTVEPYLTYGTIAWATIPGTDVYSTVTVTGQTFTDSAFVEGDIVCVKYLKKDMASRQITISSAFIPSEVKLVMTAKLYKGGSSTVVNDSSKVGTIQVVVPRFLFNGTQEISMTASGIANTPIAGSALDNPSTDCSEGGYYATITETLDGGTWYDNVIELAIADSNSIDVTIGTDKQLELFAIPSMGSAFKVPISALSDITFESKAEGTAKVSATGLVSGVAAGTTTITAIISKKKSVAAGAIVTVAT